MMMNDQLVEVTAVCKYILFENPHNHYVVARFERIDDSHAMLIGVGYLKQLELEVCFRLQGFIVLHA